MTEYANKVVFARLSKKGGHIYMFDNDGAFAAAKEGSLLMNISDLENLLAGKFESIKVSVLPKEG